MGKRLVAQYQCLTDVQVNIYQRRKQSEQGLAESKGPGGRGGLSWAGWSPGRVWGAPKQSQRDIVCSREEPTEVRGEGWLSLLLGQDRR